MKKIIDISHYQDSIDWTIARPNIELIIFRASIGNKIDQKYLQYSRDCNVPFGVYHYVKATNADEARQEAIFFVTCANSSVKRPLFYIADVEYEKQNESNTEEVTKAFLQELRKLGCKKIGIYGNSSWQWAKGALPLADFLWLPRWGKDTGEIPSEQYYPKYPCDIWQYTSKGRIPGIKGDVDLSIFHGNKTLEWFIKDEVKIMAEKFTNEHFVEFCKAFVGMPYWY